MDHKYCVTCYGANWLNDAEREAGFTCVVEYYSYNLAGCRVYSWRLF